MREENQDACAADARHGIFVVADGVGGSAGGAVAAKAVVEVLPGLIRERLTGLRDRYPDAVAGLVQQAIADLNTMLREQAFERPELRGMSSTVVLALVRQGALYVAHLGDSRAYLYGRGRLQQLTRDHSVVAVMVELGQITPEQARVHPLRNRITRCVGMAAQAEPDISRVRIEPGSRLLLCTDGLTGMLTDDEIAGILKRNRTAEPACRELVDAANRAGGLDNVTALVVDFPR